MTTVSSGRITTQALTSRRTVGGAHDGGPAEGKSRAEREPGTDGGGADDKGAAVEFGHMVHGCLPQRSRRRGLPRAPCWKVPQGKYGDGFVDVLVVGFGFSLRSAATAMIMPVWQYRIAERHWRPSCLHLVQCAIPGQSFNGVICLPLASLTSTPPRAHRHAIDVDGAGPHCAMPQPYLVPVRPTFSRIAQSSGVSGSTSDR